MIISGLWVIGKKTTEVECHFHHITLRVCPINIIYDRDFPGGLVVKNPPSNAGDAGSIPGRGTKITHAVGQVSPHTTTTEPAHHN